MVMPRLPRLLAVLLLPFAAGCWSFHRVDVNTTHKIEPIEININVNVKIQDELKETFKKQDEVDRQISESEADAALRKYLESENP